MSGTINVEAAPRLPQRIPVLCVICVSSGWTDLPSRRKRLWSWDLMSDSRNKQGGEANKKRKEKGKTRRGRKGGKHLPGRGRSVYDATHSHRLQGPISWESLKWMALGANGKQAFLSLLSHLTISRGPWHCADRLARRATGNPLSLFRHSPPTDPEVASHRFLGTANTVWTPAKTGDVFWVPLYKHIYTICLWHWQVDTMIHYSYCILNIDSWKILSPGESQDTGQGAQGDGSGSLFLRFYSLSNKILIVMNMFLKASHTVD